MTNKQKIKELLNDLNGVVQYDGSSHYFVITHHTTIKAMLEENKNQAKVINIMRKALEDDTTPCYCGTWESEHGCPRCGMIEGAIAKARNLEDD